MNTMFCFQCEQTAKGKGCAGKAGVCGKSAAAALLQDRLVAQIIRLAQACGENADPRAECLLIEGLFTTLTNVNFDETSIASLTEKIKNEADARGAEDRANGAGLEQLWNAPQDIRSLKSLLLFGVKGMAAYAFHALAWGQSDPRITACTIKCLRAIANENQSAALLDLVMELGRVNLTCMELLDKANTEACGTPEPTTVSLTIEKGPFVVISGHDLRDLKKLLEQSEGKGINVYTHGEMLPAHGYPKLKAYKHLKGHFGTAWQNQQKEFASLPAPVLFTTNCVMPPRESYADRVFTTGVARFPGAAHIDEKKDFSPVINAALKLGGYPEDKLLRGPNGGARLSTGFGHGAILAAAAKIVEAVKKGDIRHFFLVGGCDGARPSRGYYTDFVRQTPSDTVILTLACGKFRFNDMDLGTIGGLPRLLDMGQCNDAYGAIKVALALADAFKCGVNDLPLTLVLSWYEQKAVCILLTLLALGVKDILLGPSLPAFVSPGILDYLVKRFGIRPISAPDEDLKRILG